MVVVLEVDGGGMVDGSVVIVVRGSVVAPDVIRGVPATVCSAVEPVDTDQAAPAMVRVIKTPKATQEPQERAGTFPRLRPHVRRGPLVLMPPSQRLQTTRMGFSAFVGAFHSQEPGSPVMA